MELTVCVVAHNEASRLEACLIALLAQSVSGFSILVIDNGSRDSTKAIAEEVLSRHADSNTRWRVVRREVNNLGEARQQAVELADTKLVAFTDADCVVPVDWVSTLTTGLVALQSENPKIIGVGTANEPVMSGRTFHEAQRVLFKSWLGHFGSEQARDSSKSIRLVEHLPTCSVLYDRDSILEIGGFSSRHRLVCEDVDLSVRIKQAGFELAKLPGAVVSHEHSTKLRNWARKIFRYGWGQVPILLRSNEHRHPKFVLPLTFAVLFLLAAIWSSKLFAITLTSYLGAVMLATFFLCVRERRMSLWPMTARILVTTHFAYSMGMVAGFVGWRGGAKSP